MRTLVLTILFLASVYGNPPPVDIHGTISQTAIYAVDNHYLYSGTKDGSFDFTEIYINFSSQLSDRLRMGMQLSSRNFGELENFEPKIDWAFGDYRLVPEFGFRIGQVKLPFGIYNESRDVDLAKQTIVLDQGVYPEDLRLLITSVSGGSLYGIATLGNFDFDYQAYGGISKINETYYWTNVSAHNNNSPNSKINNMKLYGATGSITYNSLYKVGASYTHNSNDLTLESSDILANIPGKAGIDLQLQSILPFVFPLGLPAVPMPYIKNGLENELNTYTFSSEIALHDRLTLVSEFQLLTMKFTYSNDAQDLILKAFEDAGIQGQFLTMPIVNGASLISQYTTPISPRNYSLYTNAHLQLTENLGSSLGYAYRILKLNSSFESYRNTEMDYLIGLNYFLTDNILIKAEYHYIDGNISAYPPIGTDETSKSRGQLIMGRISFTF
ncbi:MAG: hypothetical protein OCC49_03125 [Fibrobacterales bacterium]